MFTDTTLQYIVIVGICNIMMKPTNMRITRNGNGSIIMFIDYTLYKNRFILIESQLYL